MHICGTLFKDLDFVSDALGKREENVGDSAFAHCLNLHPQHTGSILACLPSLLSRFHPNIITNITSLEALAAQQSKGALGSLSAIITDASVSS